MVGISSKPPGTWRNYHRTHKRHASDWRELRARPGDPTDWRAWLAGSAAALRGLLGDAIAANRPVTPVGGGWSFSALLAGEGTILETQRAPAAFDLAPGDLADPARDRRLHVMVGGGTRIGALNAFLEGSRRSLYTSGAHDGQSVAGACATGTHGSVLGYGSFANHVRGIHLVTAPDRSVWIERGPKPLLGGATDFADEVILDPEPFAAACVHLGGLGLVNAVLLEVSDEFEIEVRRVKRRLTRAQFQLLADGAFGAFCDAIGDPGLPYYLEVSFSPFRAWDGHAGHARATPAAITLYRKVELGLEQFLLPFSDMVDDVLNAIASGIDGIGDALVPPEQLARLVLDRMKAVPAPGEQRVIKRWGKANGEHDPEGLGPVAVHIHNDAFAVERHRLLDALDSMLPAFNADGGGHLVSTLRFVSNAAGLLPFTRFPETAVFNFDGLRTHASAEAGLRVAYALESDAIPFSQHWGKMGRITPQRLAREFGDPADPASRLARWRAARERLLSPAMRPLLASRALTEWGLA